VKRATDRRKAFPAGPAGTDMVRIRIGLCRHSPKLAQTPGRPAPPARVAQADRRIECRLPSLRSADILARFDLDFGS
jgi:hypothetical protein